MKMTKSPLLTAFVFALAAVLIGCAGRMPVPYVAGTQVELTRGNYRVVTSNAVGKSSGVYFLGVVPIVQPSHVKALSDLYSRAGLAKGKPQALVNVIEEKTTLYFILFSVPTLAIRADVVEFTD